MKQLSPAEQIEKNKLESEFAQMGQRVLDNVAYKTFFTARRAQLFDTFAYTKKDQEDVREEAWRTIQNLNAMEEFFRVSLETGKMADMALESHKEE